MAVPELRVVGSGSPPGDRSPDGVPVDPDGVEAYCAWKGVEPRREVEPAVGKASPVEAFGRELRSWRLRRGLSRKDLAERMAYHPSYVSHVEAGRQAPSHTFCERAEAALGADGVLWGLWLRVDDDRLDEVRRRAELRSTGELPPPPGWDQLVDRLAQAVVERVVTQLTAPATTSGGTQR